MSMFSIFNRMDRFQLDFKPADYSKLFYSLFLSRPLTRSPFRFEQTNNNHSVYFGNDVENSSIYDVVICFDMYRVLRSVKLRGNQIQDVDELYTVGQQRKTTPNLCAVISIPELISHLQFH